MGGSDAQAGFFYQNLVAADYSLRLLEFGTKLRSLTLEGESRARYVDDLILNHSSGARFVQIKWAKDETAALTLHNLTTSDGESCSLLAKLAKGFRQIATHPGSKEIVLVSTRRPGRSRQPTLGFDRSLAEFLSELQEPWVRAEAAEEIQSLPSFSKYSGTLAKLVEASGLNEPDEFYEFLKSLRFRLDQPDRETMAERVKNRLVRLGLEQRCYAELLSQVVVWSINSEEVRSEDVRTILGVNDRFVDRMRHRFPVDRRVVVPTPGLFNDLDAALESLDSGFILVEGEPGSGKSTALTVYLENRADICFGYYCFVPNDSGLANERLGDDAFVRSICIGLTNAFPDVEFPEIYAPRTVGLLNTWLHALSSAGRRVVFVVDGLDHVDRKSRQSLVTSPLTSVLDAHQLPPNVLIVLSSRYAAALPRSLQEHLQSDPRRRILVPRFSPVQVQEFLQRRGVSLSGELLDIVSATSGGVPIYLEYLAGKLGDLSGYEQKKFLQEAPSLRDGEIDEYHKQLWQTCEGDDRCTYILAVLAARNEFTTPDVLREMLQQLGLDLTLKAVYDSIASIQHVLRVSESKSVAIRHASLQDFVSEQTKPFRANINDAILSWYQAHPETDEAWRNRLRHLLEAGQIARVSRSCDDHWLARAWANHRPIPEIQRNLDIAWKAATLKQNFLEFVRIGLLKQQLALVERNVDLPEIKAAHFLLAMGRTEEALRRVWDGERRRCSPVEFASFCLDHLSLLKRPPAEHIVAAGLGDQPPRNTERRALETWYRAFCATTDDAIPALEEIGELSWRSETARRHVLKPADDSEGTRLNLEIQLVVVREIYLHGSLEALQRISRTTSLPEGVRGVASGGLGLRLARRGDDAAASEVLATLDVSVIPENQQRWLLLAAAELGKQALLEARADPPSLPTSLISRPALELEPSLFGLYDALRCFFLHDRTGFPWLEATVTASSEPLRGLILSLGRLARVWSDYLLTDVSAPRAFEELQSIAEELDLREQNFRVLGHHSDSAEFHFLQRAHEFYEQLWSCAVKVLSEDALEKLASWWLSSVGGERAARYPVATCHLAITLHTRLGENVRSLVRQLLSFAEESERSDQEASAVGPALLNCATAWAKCGLFDEAQRLWSSLFDVACGVGWRKDYQFSEIHSSLELAHRQDPTGTLDRIAEQMTLAYQLVGSVQPKTTGIAVEGLIELIVSASSPWQKSVSPISGDCLAGTGQPAPGPNLGAF